MASLTRRSRFHYKDYHDASKKLVMTLDVGNLSEGSLHILPKGFMRIRRYGILSSIRKHKTLHAISRQFDSN